ncbi:MAG: bifunctional helix-turn-helix transcriptional regulator/GNAT family N-acetyltransferase [Ignavibacteria bacterium]|nr:bifunctional helix-turn-helix transcriptional regulator/GNAT family N-acetyltransferase [Ignavibacteria bacterium]
MNLVKQLGEVAFGTRLRLLTDRFLGDAAKVYRSLSIDFEPRWFATYYLLSLRSPLSISDITVELGYTQPAVTQIVNILLKKGLVKIVKHKEDTRKKMLALSPKGIELLPTLEPILDGFVFALRELFDETGYDMLLVIDKIENALNEKDMFTRVSQKIKGLQKDSVEIVEYLPQYSSSFRDLNYEWLEKYFTIEDEDRKILEGPDNEILKKGGSIYFARETQGGVIVGTAALIMHDDGTYELAKMAVTEKAQGRQIGRKLAEAIIKNAKQKNAGKLFLETNHKLIPAMNLYKRLGFVQTEYNHISKYERSTICMELDLK